MNRPAAASFTALMALAALAACPGAAHAQQQQPQNPARETITWYTGDFPPHSIYEGPDKGMGTNDLAIKDFIARLPQYDHRMADAVTIRIVQSLSSDPSSCSLQLLKNPEREKTIAYSTVPHTWLMPNAVITLSKRLDAFKPYLNGTGELKLEEALASGKFRFGVSNGRAYGPAVDPVLKKHPEALVALAPSLTNPLGTVMRKLESQDEFDAGIGYAVEMTFQIRRYKLNAADYVSLPVAGSALMPLSVACSKTEQGKRILAELDKILSEPATQAAFDARYKSWLAPAVVPYYDEALKQARGHKGGGK